MRRLLFVLSVCVLTAVLIAGLLHTAPVRRYVLTYAKESLRESLQIDLQATGLGYNLFRLSFALQDVSIRSLKSSGYPPLLTASRVEINLPFSALFRRKIYLDEASLEGVRIHLFNDENGNSNLPPENEQEQETVAKVPDILISSLEITGEEFVYENRLRDVTVRLPDWHLSMAWSGEARGHEIRFRNEHPGQVSLGSRSLPLAVSTLLLQWQGDNVYVEKAALGLGASRMEIVGRIESLPDPVLDLKMEADLQVGEVSYWAAGLEDITGALRIESGFQGKFDASVLSARLFGRDLAFGKYDGFQLDTTASWETDTGVVALNALEVRSPVGNIKGNASIATVSGDSSTKLAFAGLDLGYISRELSSDITFAGTADGNIDARWPGLDWESADFRADLRMTGKNKVAERILPIEGRVEITAQSGRYRAVVRKFNAMGVNAEGVLTMDRSKTVGGSVRLDAVDLTESVDLAGRFLGRNPAALPIAGSARMEADLSGTPDALEVAAVFRGDSLSVGPIEDASLNTKFVYDHGRIRIGQADLQWKEQLLQAHGEIGLAGDSPEVTLEIRGEKIDLAHVMSRFMEDPFVDGAVNIVAEVTGPIGRPSANLKLNGTGLRTLGEEWGDFSANVSFKDGRIDFEDLIIGSPADADSLIASGFFLPDTREYGFEAKVDLDLEGLVLPAGRTVSGRFSADLNGAGSLSDPDAGVVAEVSDFALDAYRLGDFKFRARLKDHDAELHLQVPDLGVNADARLSLTAPFQGTFDAAIDIPDLAALGLRGPDGAVISGALHGSIRGSGPFSEWKSLDSHIGLDTVSVVAGGQEIEAETPIEIGMQNGILRASPSRIRIGQARLEMSGSLPLDAGQSTGEEFLVEVRGDLESLHAYFPSLHGISAKGDLQAVATIGGGLDRPEPVLKLTLRNGEVAVPEIPGPFQKVEMEMETRGREIVLDRLSANWNGAELTAGASVPLGFLSEKMRSQESSEARFHAVVRNVKPEDIPGAPDGLSGSVSMRLEGSASSLKLSDLAMGIDFDTLSLQTGTMHFEQVAASHISLQRSLVTIDRFEMAGSGIRMNLAGSLSLDGEQAVDIRLDGKSDAGLFTSLAESVRAAGPVEFELAMSGTIPDRKLSGTLAVRDGRISVRDFPVHGENISLSLRLFPDSIEIVDARGILNGSGRFDAAGKVAYGKGGIQDINLSLNAHDQYVEFPEGLRTVSNSRIRILSQGDTIMVEGNITITEGSFRNDLEIARLLGSDSLKFVEARDPFLSRLRFNVKIETARPLAVDNRQAELMVDSDLTLVGTFYRPSVTGRLTLEEGGEVYLAEHRYVVDTGVVTFVNESRIEPDINLLARTQTSGYDINLKIQGSPGRIDTNFTSNPSLPEPDIISLLLTGRTLDEARGSGLNIASQHAASYLSGQLGGRFSRTAEQTLGLSRVRIEPNLVSGDSDPGARLTVGQDLRRDLRLIYSMNLANSSDQILIGEYDLTRSFSFRGTNQYDNSRRFDFRHDLRFGGQRIQKDRRDTKFTIGGVRFRGDRVYPEALLSEKLGARTGKAYDFFRVQKGLDRLEKFYSDRDYLEARLRLQTDQREKEFDISVDIDAGLPVLFAFEGFDLPGGMRKQVRRIWQEGVFDAQRIQDVTDSIRIWFMRNRYYEAEIQCTIRNSADAAKEVVVAMQPGARYLHLRMQFDGADGIRPERLEHLIRKEKNGIVDSIVYSKKMADLLAQYYRQEGYSSVQVDPPRTHMDRGKLTATVIFQVREGPLYHIGTVGFDGNRALSDEDLRNTVVLDAGAVFHPRLLRTSIDKLEEVYWGRGYNDVRIESRTARDPQHGEVNIRFEIDEQRQGIVDRIEIADNNDVSDGFIRKHLRLDEGDVLDHNKTELSRRALYKTGSFELVDLEAEPLAPSSDDADASRSSLLLRARVREVVPYNIRYGGFFDTDRGPGAIFDFENRNSLLGGARLLGFRGRYDADLKEARGYLGQPLYFKFPSVASLSVFYRRESFESTDTEAIGGSLQHQMELRENMVLSYGYRFEKKDTTVKEPNFLSLPDTTLNVAPLTTSFSWDTRDVLLDATHGFFLSNALEYAPSFLGSDLHYMKYFGQVFKYLPLSSPVQVPFSRGVKRPRLVYAGGVRVGLAGGFNSQVLPESERFFAGGGTSIRGFEQNSIGPVNELGDPAGGEAVFIVNNELRFPLKSIFEGVGFMDFGNVYPRVQDFNPFDVRGSIGPGLRVRTPYFLLRFDYGFKLDQKPGESAGEFYFSIGQAF